MIVDDERLHPVTQYSGLKNSLKSQWKGSLDFIFWIVMRFQTAYVGRV